jgi:murein DD-endopeptidase MepM/ murein hydrolase activator NlpD
VVGVVALAAVGGGAATVGHSHSPSGAFSLSAQGRALEGTDAHAYVGSRTQALSRGAERVSLKDATDARLQAAGVQQAARRHAAHESRLRVAKLRAEQIARNAWHLPTEGYHLTARFGMTSGLWSSFHTGLDFAAPTGTPIFAVAGGRITETGWAGSYGNRTVETLPDGTELWYAHQSAIGVKVGQVVTGGQTIGEVGSTGNTTGPHVHLEVRPHGGDPVDPYPALVAHGLHP